MKINLDDGKLSVEGRVRVLISRQRRALVRLERDHCRRLTPRCDALDTVRDISNPGFLDRGGGLQRCGDASKLVDMAAHANTGRAVGLVLSILSCTTRSNCLAQFSSAGGVAALVRLIGVLSARHHVDGRAPPHARRRQGGYLMSLATAERTKLLLWILDILFRLPVTLENLRQSRAGEVIAGLSRTPPPLSGGAVADSRSRAAQIRFRAASIKAKWLRMVNNTAV